MKKFDKTTGCFIEKGESKKMIENYHKRFPHETKFAIFGKDIIEKLLTNYENCHGIKISFGTNEDGQIKPILHAVDENALEIEDSSANASILCPPHCPTA